MKLVKVYAVTINFVQRFNSEKSSFKIKVSIYNKNKQTTFVLLLAKVINVVIAQLHKP